VGAFLAAGRGLVAAHEAGIVHRDVKPANILIDRRGRVAVTDFGIARMEGSARGVGHAGTLAQTTWATQTGAMMGTPAYMSPEQYLSTDVDARSDQWSFAVALYEAVFRVPPFAGRTGDERRKALLTGSFSPLDPALVARVPKRLYRALMRALSRDRAARFPRLADLLDELAAPPSAPRRRFRVLAAGVGTLAAVSIVVTTLLFRKDDPPGEAAPNAPPKVPVVSRLAPESTPARLATLNETIIKDRVTRAGWRVLNSTRSPELMTVAAESRGKGALIAVTELTSPVALDIMLSRCKASAWACDSGGTRVLSVHLPNDPDGARALLKIVER